MALAYPYLMLLVSGGHCQFLLVGGPEDFTRLGGTIDDAPGEAFDKTARLLGLAQPGGPAVEAEARRAMPRGLPFRARCWTGRAATCLFRASRPRSCAQRDALIADAGRADACRTAPIFAPGSRRPCATFWPKRRAAR